MHMQLKLKNKHLVKYSIFRNNWVGYLVSYQLILDLYTFNSNVLYIYINKQF